MRCNVCHADTAASLGSFRPYIDYECEVYECPECGSRFVQRDPGIYERLHASATSPYAAHDDLGRAAIQYFQNHDLAGLRAHLRSNPKNRLVIDTLDGLHAEARLLEIGCSRGYLTAYFILAGKQVVGTDISASAVAAASAAFGERFMAFDAERLAGMAPFDAIYHVGTIGCVDDPGGLTRTLLGWLKPDGILVFNAPDVQACRESGGIWLRGTTPPDLVTLFDAQFWRTRFNDLAVTSIEKLALPGYVNFALTVRRLAGRATKQPPRGRLFSADSAPVTTRGQAKDGITTALKKAMVAGLNSRLLSWLWPKHTAEFGLYVIMRRRS